MRLKFVPFLFVLLLLAIPAHAQSVTLSWGASTVAAGSPPVTSYQVWRGTASGAETLLVNPGNVLTFTDTTVVAGQTYFYEVFGLNSVGPSKASNEAIAVIPVAVLIVPAPPVLNPPVVTPAP